MARERVPRTFIRAPGRLCRPRDPPAIARAGSVLLELRGGRWGHDAAREAALAKSGDASRFAWLPGDERQYDLVVTFDDATSAVYSGFIVE